MPNTEVRTRSARRKVLARAATTITERRGDDLAGTAEEVNLQTQQFTYDQNTHGLLQELLIEQRLIRMHLELMTGQTITEQDIETR